MTIRPAGIFLLCALLGACGGTDQEAESAETDATALTTPEAELDALAQYYETHFNLHHASMVAELFTDSAVQLSANGLVSLNQETIQARLEETMGALPELAVSHVEKMIFGDNAVGLGTYTVSTTPEGQETINYGGAFLNLYTRRGEDWKIEASIVNYSAEMPADMWTPDPDFVTPPEEGLMSEFMDNYVLHSNLGHASMVADLYNDDAITYGASVPVATGREEIELVVEAGMAQGSSQLEIHDIGTRLLGDRWAITGGWYGVEAERPDGPISVLGNYMALLQKDEADNWKIHRLVSNGGPAPN